MPWCPSWGEPPITAQPLRASRRQRAAESDAWPSLAAGCCRTRCSFLHRGERVAHAQQQLTDLFRDLLIDVAAAGQLRDDVTPAELATYCLHALTAAGSLPSEAAVRRLVAVTLTGLRPAH
ncbi:SbtR family transcriptional regulator [Streptomyces marianii]|uniref:SbtR family transcriptional regulator n=1 Tax=Streptomyces marianii TaxID=1817406 RepID=UPI0018F8CE70|nr:hypothetical protein [Streptomyces marianii]